MSAYLSPIMSSGDTTPPQQATDENQQQQECANNQTNNKSVNPFQARVEISTGEIAQKLHQNKLKSQQSHSAASNKRQKTSLSSMGNSMLVNESSSSSSANSSGDELEQRAAAKAVVLNCFRKRHEQELGGERSDEEEEDEEGEAEDDSFGQRVEKSQCACIGTENKRKQEPICTNSSSNSSHCHQTLAEQFLQAGNKQAGASFRLNYDQSKGHQLHELLAGFSARSSRLVGGGERLNKKFKQILQSIPMVPTLLATTSIMTLVLLLCLLLLSDTPRATALRDQRDHEPPIQSVQEDHRQESLVNEQPSVGSTAGEFKFVLADESTAGASLAAPELSREALRREFIKDAFLAKQAQPQHHGPHHNQHHHHFRNEQTVAAPAPAAQRHPGRLPPHLARVRSSSKRNSDQRDFGALASEQIELADEPAATQQQQQQQTEVSGANLFNSIGSMLFGATQEQQHSSRQPVEAAESSEPLDQAAVLMEGEPALSSLLRSVEGVGPAGSEGGEREPARLRSSALELDLSPEQSADVPRPRAHHKQQQQHHHSHHQYQATAPAVQQQHDSTRHHANNHERPFDVALVQCNNTVEGFERFACPSPDLLGRYRCIEDRLFCDGYYDCPNGEDEDRVHCMYYRLNQNRQTNVVGVGQHPHQHSAAATSVQQHQNNQNQQHQQHHMTDAMALDT